MTILHEPGSFSAVRFTGTLASTRIGSMSGAKPTYGSFSRPFVSTAYGSFGTLAGAVFRAQQGSFVGTISAHRSLITSLPGVVSSRVSGTLHGYFSAPSTPRWIQITVQLAPTATKVGRAALRQSLRGTIGYAEVEAAVAENPAGRGISGIVMPGGGSYVLGSYGAGVSYVTKTWREWDV